MTVDRHIHMTDDEHILRINHFVMVEKLYKLILRSLFYPHYAMLARVLAVVVCWCVCVCLSLCRYIKTVKHRVIQTTPCDSPGILFLWREQSLVVDSTPPEICAIPLDICA